MQSNSELGGFAICPNLGCVASVHQLGDQLTSCVCTPWHVCMPAAADKTQRKMPWLRGHLMSHGATPELGSPRKVLSGQQQQQE